jgi:hypothetical protein
MSNFVFWDILDGVALAHALLTAPGPAKSV